MYLVLNDVMSVFSKFNSCEICQQKIISQLTNKRHILVSKFFFDHIISNYFYTYISYLLSFNTNDI